MKKVMMLYDLKTYTVIFVLICQRRGTSAATLTAFVGEMVSITCNISVNDFFRWDFKHRTEDNALTVYVGGHFAEGYEHRYTLEEKDENSGHVLTILNITEADGGLYICINDRDDQVTRAAVNVSSIGRISVQPSVVNATIGSDVTLSCISPWNVQLTKWTRRGRAATSTDEYIGDPTGVYNGHDGRKFTIEGGVCSTTSIQFMNLTISSLEPDDSGYYVCYASRSPSAAAVISVNGHPHESNSKSVSRSSTTVGMIAGLTVAVVITVLLIALVIKLWHGRKTHIIRQLGQQQQQYNEIPRE